MPSPEQKFVKELLKKYGITPSKRMGQNFLVDRRVLQRIAEAAELKPNEVVLEIGSGLGNLTLELAKGVKRVIAVEKDEKMIEVLRGVLNSQKIENVKIIHGDILKLLSRNPKLPPLAESPTKSGQILNSKFQIPKHYKVVANLPYYIASPVIRKFLESVEVKPQQMILMVQKEVAQRICAKPPNMSILALSVQFYAEPKIIAYVSKRCFFPRPKVDSAIIKITPFKFRSRFRSRTVLDHLFFRVVRAGFLHPRKQLLNNLTEGLKIDKEKVKNWLLENNIQPSQRAETLGIDDWLRLVKKRVL